MKIKIRSSNINSKLSDKLKFNRERFNFKQAVTILYYAVQATLRTNECDLPVYRFMCQWKDSNDTPWYVVVIGEKPPEAVHPRLTTVLARGEMSDIPQQALDALLIRRRDHLEKGIAANERIAPFP